MKMPRPVGVPNGARAGVLRKLRHGAQEAPSKPYHRVGTEQPLI
jgi:hypothetical protein